jgi:hypothetical protein
MQPAFITALALVIAAPASAGTIFQSLPDLTVAPVVAGYCSSCNAFLPFRIYDSFTLASAATVNTVTFAIDTSFYAGNSVNVGFFARNGALPGASIASYDFAPSQFTNVTSLMTGERTRALVTVDIGSLALGAGDYAISFFNPAGLSIPAYANPGGSLYQSGNFFSPSTFYADRSAAFSLASAAVPEPASWAMMIIGFGLVGAARRRRVVVAA